MTITEFSNFKKYDASTIKLGLLKYYKNRLYFTYHNTSIYIMQKEVNLRGILYQQQGNIGKDLLHDEIVYPFYKKDPKDTAPHLGIYKGVSLESLCQYLSLEKLTQADLIDLKEQILTNKKWLYDHMHLFGQERIDLGFDKIILTKNYNSIISSSIFPVIEKINHTKYGYEISKKEEKIKEKYLQYREK